MTQRPCARAPARQRRGMALVAVLWIVAALSLLVMGVSATVRERIRMAGATRDAVSAEALADAAIALALQQLLAAPQRFTGIVRQPAEFGGARMEVELAPLNGLISLNGAGVPLFQSLLRVAGGLEPARAEALARALVAWRDGRFTDGMPGDAPPDAAPQRRRDFEAAEDLMLVPGMDYDLYSRIAPLVSADLPRSGQVNPDAAPLEVLQVLADGNAGAAATFARQRDSGQPGADRTGLQGALLGGGGTNLYRVRAGVPLEAGKMFYLTRDVVVRSGGARTAPWRTLHTERHTVTARD